MLLMNLDASLLPDQQMQLANRAISFEGFAARIFVADTRQSDILPDIRAARHFPRQQRLRYKHLVAGSGFL